MSIKRTVTSISLLLLAAGCSSAASGEQQSGGAGELGTPASSAALAGLTDAQYLELVRGKITFYSKATDEQLFEVGRAFCGVLQANPHPAEGDQTRWVLLVKQQTDAGMDAGEAGSMPVYAAGWGCPEELDQVGGLVELQPFRDGGQCDPRFVLVDV